MGKSRNHQKTHRSAFDFHLINVNRAPQSTGIEELLSRCALMRAGVPAFHRGVWLGFIGESFRLSVDRRKMGGRIRIYNRKRAEIVNGKAAATILD